MERQSVVAEPLGDVADLVLVVVVEVLSRGENLDLPETRGMDLVENVRRQPFADEQVRGDGEFHQ